MTPPKVAVIFYSTYGTNHRMAQIAAEAAQSAGAEVRLRRVAETAPKDVVEGQDAWKEQAKKTADIAVVSHDDMEWADAYFFAAPTRYGVVASQLRAFIDTLGPLWMAGKLADKTVTAVTSAQNTHGGQEATLLSLYTTFMHWGAILVAPGYTDPVLFESGGNPYGYSHTAGEGFEKAEPAIAHQVRRLVDKTAKLIA